MVRDNPHVKIPPPRVIESDPPVGRAVLAQAIVDISKAATKLAASGINRRAIVILLSDSSGVGRHDVKAVLDGLETLAANYTR
jgi:hypothetical protein